MKTLAHLVVLAAVGTSLAAASAQESRAVLRQVEERLRPVLADLSPAPTIEYPEYSQSLLVYYRPQKFLVHGRSMTSEWTTNVLEQVGPSFTGFVLRVRLERLGEVIWAFHWILFHGRVVRSSLGDSLTPRTIRDLPVASVGTVEPPCQS